MIKASRGTHDFLPEQTETIRWIEDCCTNIFHRFNFKEIKTPIFEETSLFTHCVGDSTEIVQKEMYTFLDKGNRSLTLRPEGTASVVRSCIQHAMLDSIQKLFYIGPFFRYERPQAGRFRQFHQVGVEYLGQSTALADVEIISLAACLFNALGISGLTIHINSLGSAKSRKAILNCISTFFEPYLKDLDSKSLSLLKTNPLRILDSKNKQIQKILENFKGFKNYLDHESITHFEHVLSSLEKIDISYHIDPLLVRGLDYYTHTTFELKSDELGAQSTLCGGGRYDHLVEKLGGKPTPAVGFAFGLERLLSLIKTKSLNGANKKLTLFVPLGEKAKEYCLKLVNKCRAEGFICDVMWDDAKIVKHLKFGNKINANKAIIIGDNELKENTFVSKEFDTGHQETLPISKLYFILNK